MKKLISVFLCAALFLSIIPGCSMASDETDIPESVDVSTSNSTEESDAEPLRLCVDFGDMNLSNPGEQIVSSSVDTLEMQYKAGYGGPAEIEFEVVPYGTNVSAERETALSRLRTEIMSGGGPDVYIATCSDSIGIDGKYIPSLFPFPDKAMASGYFLPLDDYIKNAQFMELDKLEPAVMEAGKYDGRQMILPMTFRLPVTTFVFENGQEYDTEAMTWNDMVETNDPVLAAAAALVITGCQHSTNELLPYTLDSYADYDTEKLLITEDELFQRVMDVQRIMENEQAEKAPTHKTEYISQLKTTVGANMIPLYNTNGGATAIVKSFCAINSNTSQPENAFYVADYFLSESMQKESGVYSAWMVGGAMITDTEYVKSKMEETHRDELARVFDQISNVRYWTPLDNELSNILGYAVYYDWDEEEIHQLVSEAYKNMQMMLAES